MATLYWGGGTGTWDGFTITNWYTDFARLTPSTRAPSAEDDVIFDSASNATDYTVTISGNTTVCRNVTIAGPATGNLTLAGTGTWFIYGNLTLPATGFTRTLTSQIQFWGIGSHTITTNNVALASLFSFQGLGTYTLQDALNTSGNLTINGVFNTNDKNLTCATITSSVGGNAGTLTLGASTVSATTILANAPLTINAGTSNITLSAANASIGGGVNYTGNTFNNVTFSSNAVSAVSLRGANTFNNLTFTTPAAAGVSFINLFGNQTVTGTFTISGQSSVNRYVVRSDTVGTTRTLTVGTVATLTDVDFRDITVSGASSPWSGTRLGDCGGNTNITFPGAKTVYWNKVAGGLWYDTAWATSSGGSVAASNFPLAQDTAIIDDTGLNASSTITMNYVWNIGTITSTKTNAYTLSGTPVLYGNLTLTTSTTVSGFIAAFQGRVTQNLTSAGNTLAGITCNSFGASVTLAGNTTTGSWTITSGGLDTNNNSFTVSSSVSVSTASTSAFTLTLGSSAVSIAGAAGLSSTSVSAPPMTVSAGTSTITLTNASATFGFEGQTLTWYNVTKSAPNGPTVFYGNNTFNNVTFPGTATTAVINISLGGNQTINGTLALVGGTSVTQRRGVISNIIGTQRTITAATVTGLTDIDFRDINAAGAANWTTGTRLGDCGNNTGITFPAAKTVYWNLSGTQNWSATAWATGSGGTPSANNFPLAQDTAVIDDTGSAGTVTIQGFNIGTINAGSRTSAWTLSVTTPATIYGDVIYGAGTTQTGGSSYTFSGRGTQTFTTAGKTVENALIINKPFGTFQHADAFTSLANITITEGTYNTQNYNISTNQLISNNSNTRSITLGTSTLTLSTINALNFNTSTTLTFNGTSSTINLSIAGSKSLNGGGQAFGTVNVTGGTTAHTFTITGSNTFGTLANSAYNNIIWAAGTTQTITNFTYSGASGNVVRWYTNIPGQRAIIKTASAAIGANSTDGGNNSGLTFTGTSPDYFYVKDIEYAANALLVYITESATVSSSESPQGTYNPTISESSTGSDSVASSIIVIATLSESSTGSDSVTANVASLVFDGASASEIAQAVATLQGIISEQIQAGDRVTALSILNAFIAEGATASDSTARFASFSSFVSESVVSSDQVSVANVFNSVIAEAVSGLDVSAVVASTFAAAVAEVTQGADLVNAPGSLYNVIVLESAEVNNLMFGAYLWNGISDIPESYSGISDNPATWTVIADNSETWKPVE